MKKSKARMSQRICEGRFVCVFTRLGRVIRPSGCRCWIIQTPGFRHYWQKLDAESFRQLWLRGPSKLESFDIASSAICSSRLWPPPDCGTFPHVVERRSEKKRGIPCQDADLVDFMQVIR